ncbi:hypothetical protein AM499_10840 [Bacillus sp. FJAT-22090]|uniref:CYTH domain-containing protein n=1 Tax=Bacillus sp. FJAT-22090 TaxID=1581038 RepID=UPI0006AF7077|nr:CYTH domain-containing protein [Bacillus sp. FJAT-22090]ALC86272.1 hypothetical protein AM499_10840 [Bacillus sp. FJAT-22090]
MHTEKEIEFKNLLTKDEFEQMLAHFQVDSDDFYTQTNYYFDTSSNYFKEKKMGFRLRVMANKNELTLKVPEKEHIMNETTYLLTDSEKEEILQNLHFPDIPIINQIKNEGTLTCIGSMQTNRANKTFENGMLFFDHSLYSQTEDFEVEYECDNVENGKKVFVNLLESLQIPIRSADKKIARLINYNHTLKG